MTKYHNKKETKKIGTRIRNLRLAHEFSIEDISTMTGFARSTIKAIENGGETDLSHAIEIAKAIGVHPKEVFEVSIDIKPRFKLPPDRVAKSKLTLRLNKLVLETDFFDTPKFVGDVRFHLQEEIGLKINSTHASVVLKRLVQEKKLSFSKIGRQNSYVKRY